MIFINSQGATSPRKWQHGTGAIFVTGTFNSNQLRLEFRPDGGDVEDWFNVKDVYGDPVTAQSQSQQNFTLPNGDLRVVLSEGSSSGIAVYVNIVALAQAEKSL